METEMILEVLQFGDITKVGDGTDTLVWGWRWLADSADPNLQSECIDELKEAKVCNLFNENGDWDERRFELGLAFGVRTNPSV
nr:uncharacterized protein LOC109159815 [Ipomoea trifida]